MKKLTIKFFCICASIFLAFSLTACFSSLPNIEPTGSDLSDETETLLTIHDVNTDYRIEKIGDQWYLIFEDERIYDVEPHTGDPLAEWRLSLGKLRTILTLENTLTISERQHIALYFPRDTIGVKLFDVESFYIPTLPNSVTYYLGDDGTPSLLWHGNQYTWDTMEKTNQNNWYSIAIYQENDFYHLFDPADFSDRGEMSSDERRWILRQNDKTFYVEDDSEKSGSRVHLTIFAIEDDKHFVMYIDCDSLPTDEFLLSFGLMPYEEKPTE